MYKFNFAWSFVIRQRFTTIRFECLGIHIGASYNEGFDLLTHAFRRHTNHRRFDHCWMPVQHLFNITWVNIKSATYNQILLPLNNTPRVWGSQISARNPPE